MREVPCDACKGARLKPASLAVTVGGRNIAEIAGMAIDEVAAFMRDLQLTEREARIAERVIKEINERLRFLLDVGLDYLTLARPAGTLSGGEAQRIRLATQIGSGLTGVLYVLDEPSIGLHQRDNRRLIDTLLRLRDLGNTLIVVEHDEDTIKVADWIVDIGPGAGEHGGRVVVSGSRDDLLASEESLTGAYLSGRRVIPVPAVRRPGNGKAITVADATENNLRNVTVDFPLGRMIAVTGVSGSGKSTLVNQILYRALAKELYGASDIPGRHGGITASAHRQGHSRRPVAHRTHARSNPATYRRVRPHPQAVRRTPEAKSRLSAGPVLVQRQRRPLRELLGRRHDQDRDELPAGRLRRARCATARATARRSRHITGKTSRVLTCRSKKRSLHPIMIARHLQTWSTSGSAMPPAAATTLSGGERSG